MDAGKSPRLGAGRLTIGGYLIQRLRDYGIEHVFGIPGDYILAFYAQLEQSSLGVVGTTREDCAGFAADAYARVRGMGAVCVTYCVGGLSVCNSVAGAYAEKSPVVVISGSPGLGERKNNLQGAVSSLVDTPEVWVTAVSPVYETEPVGTPEGSKPFLNAVVLADTTLSARTLPPGKP